MIVIAWASAVGERQGAGETIGDRRWRVSPLSSSRGAAGARRGSDGPARHRVVVGGGLEVAPCGLEGGAAEQLLDLYDVGLAFERGRGEGVAQGVNQRSYGDLSSDPSPHVQTLDEVLNLAVGERAPLWWTNSGVAGRARSWPGKRVARDSR